MIFNLWLLSSDSDRGIFITILTHLNHLLSAGGHPGRPQPPGPHRDLPPAGVRHQPRAQAAPVRHVAAPGHRHPGHLLLLLQLQPGPGHQVGPHHREGQLQHGGGVLLHAGQHLTRQHQHQHHQEQGGAAGRHQQGRDRWCPSSRTGSPPRPDLPPPTSHMTVLSVGRNHCQTENPRKLSSLYRFNTIIMIPLINIV